MRTKYVCNALLAFDFSSVPEHAKPDSAARARALLSKQPLLGARGWPWVQGGLAQDQDREAILHALASSLGGTVEPAQADLFDPQG